VPLRTGVGAGTAGGEEAVVAGAVHPEDAARDRHRQEGPAAATACPSSKSKVITLSKNSSAPGRSRKAGPEQDDWRPPALACGLHSSWTPQALATAGLSQPQRSSLTCASTSTSTEIIAERPGFSRVQFLP
jgi:hypothetical protein